MKNILFPLALALLLTGCGSGREQAGEYTRIDQETALTMMEGEENPVILDVREQGEYDGGHIPGAVLLPVGEIDETSAAAVIPEKDTAVLVYCRSGNRSRTAAQALADLGYTAVFEFGGIRDWPYGIETKGD